MLSDAIDLLLVAWPNFCFGYPFVMAWYWMAGGILFYLTRERPSAAAQDPATDAWPPISILVPCYNEAANAEETLSAALAVDYPDFEVLAINDGSRDETAAVLDRLAGRQPKLRVVHLAANQGKANALNSRRPPRQARAARLHRRRRAARSAGAPLGRPHVPAQHHRRITGNPRIRNRSSMLGRLQVGEFSSIIGLIRRAQTMYGRLFTVSGVLCAFRKCGAGTVGLVVVAHAHGRYRRHLAHSARGLARGL